jgi:putative protease
VKILAPLNAVEETDMLLANGAEELYCGLVPEEWVARYTGAVWLNRRSPVGGNLRSFSDLARVVEQAHRASVPVFITLNAQTYTAEQLPMVVDLARRYVQEAGADALIVSDPALLMALAEENLACALHLSSIASSLNSSAIQFFRTLGVRRVILPRSLTLAEIARIVSVAGPETEIEVFILNDGCIFEEGNCLTTHHHSVGAFCTGLMKMTSQTVKFSGKPWASGEEDKVKVLLEDFRQRIGILTNSTCSTPSPGTLPPGPCGLCAIPFFERIGVASLKIVGREASPMRKLMSLRLVRAVVAKQRSKASEGEVQEYAQSIRCAPSRCTPGEQCYYELQPASMPTAGADTRKDPEFQKAESQFYGATAPPSTRAAFPGRR